MLLQSASSGGSPVVSADPGLLQRFASEAASRTQGLEAAETEADRAVTAWNAEPCDARFAVRIVPPASELDALSGHGAIADEFVAEVAAAFLRADTSYTSWLRVITQGALDNHLVPQRGYNPIAQLSKNDPALWDELTGGGTCG